MANEIGERMKRIREEIGLNQKDFADALGISAPTLSGYESGGSKPTFEVLVKLSEQYKINVYYILFGKGDMFENPLLEFLINMEEKDLAVKAEHIRKFLEDFGKSRQLQYYLLIQYEDRIADELKMMKKEAGKTGKENI